MRSVLVLTAATVVAVAGCTAVKPPTATVTGARVVDVTAAGAQMAVDVLLTNPNDEPLPLTRADYRVSAPDAGLRAYAFAELPNRTIPGRGSQRVTLPAALPATEARAVAVRPGAWRVSGSFTYAPDRGLRAFLTETGVPLPEVGFNGSSKFEVRSTK